jgi:hypothetical protein
MSGSHRKSGLRQLQTLKKNCCLKMFVLRCLLFIMVRAEIQVDRFWKELRDKYDCEELIGSERSGRKIGIGLIHVKNNGLFF